MARAVFKIDDPFREPNSVDFLEMNEHAKEYWNNKIYEAREARNMRDAQAAAKIPEDDNADRD